jgi:hypothetical protein
MRVRQLFQRIKYAVYNRRKTKNNIKSNSHLDVLTILSSVGKVTYPKISATRSETSKVPCGSFEGQLLSKKKKKKKKKRKGKKERKDRSWINCQKVPGRAKSHFTFIFRKHETPEKLRQQNKAHRQNERKTELVELKYSSLINSLMSADGHKGRTEKSRLSITPSQTNKTIRRRVLVAHTHSRQRECRLF